MINLEQKRTVTPGLETKQEIRQEQKVAAQPQSLGKLNIPKKTDGALDKMLGFGNGNTVIDKIITKLASFIKSIENWILGRANTVEPIIKIKRKKLGTNEDENTIETSVSPKLKNNTEQKPSL